MPFAEQYYCQLLTGRNTSGYSCIPGAREPQSPTSARRAARQKRRLGASQAAQSAGDPTGLRDQRSDRPHEIARLGLSVIIIEGDDGKTLRRAAGHVRGTALPGQLGNVGITAHRDTFFRPLRNIQLDDVITLTTLQGEYRYRVVSTKVVRPADVAVLDSTGGEILTLVTCHPFYFVGAAPNRFIVRAERVKG
jgi:sortase A